MDGAAGETELGEFAPWYFGEPNGNTAENCVVVWVNRRAWNDQVSRRSSLKSSKKSSLHTYSRWWNHWN